MLMTAVGLHLDPKPYLAFLPCPDGKGWTYTPHPKPRALPCPALLCPALPCTLNPGPCPALPCPTLLP